MTRAPSSFRLPDGRGLHMYADDCDGRPRDRDGLPGGSDSRRPATPAGPGSVALEGAGPTLRWDPFVEEWVVMAAHRAKRPVAAEDTCPLCPSAEPGQCEIPGGAYDVAVFDNRYPALVGPSATGSSAAPLTGPAAEIPATGACEVMSFGSGHTATLAGLPLRRLRTVVEAWADRTRTLNGRQDIAQVVCFENHGAQIGATLAHPHGQIYGYSFLPPRLRRMGDAARRVRDAGGGCVFCEVVAAEATGGQRVVAQTRRWVAFVPYAARWPFEVQLFARRHVPDLPALDEEEREELAAVYRSVLRRFASVSDEPLPYMALWVQAPARQDRELAHLHAQIFSDRSAAGRVKRLAAGELGAGAWVSETEPEHAAAALRAADPDWPAGQGPRTGRSTA